ncbi:MAG: arsenate reductase ArsC [Gammaproteobacteria bacterium]
MKRLLFGCVENSCRSQLAEALTNVYGGKQIQAYSAGSSPSGVVNPKAIAAMADLDYDLQSHRSKSLQQIPGLVFDYVISMGCGDSCRSVLAFHKEDWQIPDPRPWGRTSSGRFGTLSHSRSGICSRVAYPIGTKIGRASFIRAVRADKETGLD